MSRCFPYRPHEGYAQRGTLRGTLIESMKLQKEKEKAEMERRKPRKKESKHSIVGDNKASKLNHKKSRGKKDEDYVQDFVKATESSEKSALTEEHGQPIGFENSSYLSDGSKSSNKRKQDASFPSIERRGGNVIRIRLKHKAPETHDGGQPGCSATEIADSLPRSRFDTAHASNPSADVKEISLEKLECSSIRDGEFASRLSSSENELSSYETLMENLLLPPLKEVGLEASDDLEWLFETKHTERNGPKRHKSGDDVSLCAKSLWPRAHYLPEAEIYALPYTVPF